MKKKIVHILTGMCRGGCEGNALCLIANAQDHEHEVLVLGGGGEMSEEFVKAGANILYLSPTLNPWKFSAQIRKKAAEINPDGVIVWHGMVMLPIILHALRHQGIRVMVHGGNPAYSMPWWVDLRYFFLETLLGERAAATYVCCSRYVADSFRLSRYLRRFPTVVVPNGVKSLNVLPHEPRHIQGESTAIIGMVARLDEIKDHVTLLKAFALVLQKHPKIVLELAGEGRQRASLEALASELGITDKVSFLGLVEDIYPRIKSWDVFAYATTAQEGLGNALAEAMMVGLPCVATDVGPVRELAGEPPAIALATPADASALASSILHLLEDTGERRRFGAAGRERALSAFSQNVYAQGYLKLLFP